jgi:hypothetical protein
MSLLMPAMSHVRENTHRVICASNQRQLGQAVFAFGADHKDRLPYSATLHTDDPQPWELMATRQTMVDGNSFGWDGLGLLFMNGYCATANCYYCPSHHGEHSFERYEEFWDPAKMDPSLIYSNFHYCGDVDWSTGDRRSLHTGGYELVLITDGLRTSQDFNHWTGMNVVRGDGSVRWRDEVQGVLEHLPVDPQQNPGPEYEDLWNDEIEIPG